MRRLLSASWTSALARERLVSSTPRIRCSAGCAWQGAVGHAGRFSVGGRMPGVEGWWGRRLGLVGRGAGGGGEGGGGGGGGGGGDTPPPPPPFPPWPPPESP